jgi:hypothetical protein
MGQMSKALPVFEVETAKHTAQRVRDLSSTVSKISWALDEALFQLRIADPEDILTYSELIGKVLIAQRDADLFMLRRIHPETVEPPPQTLETV